MTDDIITLNTLRTAEVMERSRAWYYRRVKELQNATSSRTLMREGKLQKTVSPGFMAFFIYDAKFKKKLPFWDAFPLIMVLDRARDGFYGINLHYVSVNTRMELLRELIKYDTNPYLTKKSKLNYTWQTLNRLHPILKPMTKRYLYSHMRSLFRRIDGPDWGFAAMLPVAEFQKTTNSYAQRLTAIEIKKNKR